MSYEDSCVYTNYYHHYCYHFTAGEFLPRRLGLRNTLTALFRGVRPPNECPVYDTKRSAGELPVMLEFYGMWNISSLPSLPGPIWPGVVTPERVLFMGQVELNCMLMLT